jgi:hypothetical protein
VAAKKDLRKLIEAEVRSVLKEDYARGIPDFALQQVSSNAADELKQHIRRYIEMTAHDPVKHRQMLGAANRVLEELEVDMKELLEEKLLKFIRSV